MQQARPFLLAQKADAHGSKNAENQYLTGVVIEEDGLTEEEFLAEMKERHASLNVLNNRAKKLEELIHNNLSIIQ